MSFEIKQMQQSEEKYTYKQSNQICGQTGFIGYLRADMDSNGNGFYSTWNDYRADLKTDEFKDEFDNMINIFRETGNFLADRNTLRRFCYESASQYKNDNSYFGIRINSDKYVYLCRLNPNKGEYNLYCYCYKKDQFDEHLKQAENGIRFISPNYKELFRIKDGDSVRVTYPDSKAKDYACRYIDNYHVEVGDYLFHICEFAEKLENCGAKIAPLQNVKDRGDTR